jgi:hypothetical protein
MGLLPQTDTSRKGRRVMTKEKYFNQIDKAEYSRLLLECYRSAQMTERQYQKHVEAGDIKSNLKCQTLLVTS